MEVDSSTTTPNLYFLQPSFFGNSQAQRLNEVAQYKLLIEAETLANDSNGSMEKVELVLTDLCNMAGSQITAAVQARVLLLQARLSLHYTDTSNSDGNVGTKENHFFIAVGTCLRHAIALGIELQANEICFNASLILVNAIVKLKPAQLQLALPMLRYAINALEKVNDSDRDWLFELVSMLCKHMSTSFVQLVKGKPAPPVKVDSNSSGGHRQTQQLFIDNWPPPAQDPFGDCAKDIQSEFAKHSVHLLNLVYSYAPWLLLEKCALVRTLAARHTNLEQRLQMELAQHPTLNCYFQVTRMFEESLQTLFKSSTDQPEATFPAIPAAQLAKDLLTQKDSTLLQMYNLVLALDKQPDTASLVDAVFENTIDPRGIEAKRASVLKQFVEIVRSASINDSWQNLKRSVAKIDTITSFLARTPRFGNDLLDIGVLVLVQLLEPFLQNEQLSSRTLREIGLYLCKAADALQQTSSHQLVLRVLLHFEAARMLIASDDSLNEAGKQLQRASSIVRLLLNASTRYQQQNAQPFFAKTNIIFHYQAFLQHLEQRLKVKLSVMDGSLSPAEGALSLIDQARQINEGDQAKSQLLEWALKTVFPRFERPPISSTDVLVFEDSWAHWKQTNTKLENLVEIAHVLNSGLLLCKHLNLENLGFCYAMFLIVKDAEISALGATYELWTLDSTLCHFQIIASLTQEPSYNSRIAKSAIAAIQKAREISLNDSRSCARLQHYCVKTLWNALLSKVEAGLGNGWFDVFAQAYNLLKDFDLIHDLLFVQVSTAYMQCIYTKVFAALHEEKTTVQKLAPGPAATGKAARAGNNANSGTTQTPDGLVIGPEETGLVKLADEVYKTAMQAKLTPASSKIGLIECRGQFLPFRAEGISNQLQSVTLETDPLIKTLSMLSLVANSKLASRESTLKMMSVPSLLKIQVDDFLKMQIILALAKFATGCEMFQLAFELVQLLRSVNTRDDQKECEQFLRIQAYTQRLEGHILLQTLAKKWVIRSSVDVLQSGADLIGKFSNWAFRFQASVKDKEFAARSMFIAIQIVGVELFSVSYMSRKVSDELFQVASNLFSRLEQQIAQNKVGDLAESVQNEASELETDLETKVPLYQKYQTGAALYLYYLISTTSTLGKIPAANFSKLFDKITKGLPKPHRKLLHFGRLITSAYYGFQISPFLLKDYTLALQAQLSFLYARRCIDPLLALNTFSVCFQLVNQSTLSEPSGSFQLVCGIGSDKAAKSFKIDLILALAYWVIENDFANLCSAKYNLVQLVDQSLLSLENPLESETSQLQSWNLILVRAILRGDDAQHCVELIESISAYLFKILQKHGLMTRLYSRILYHQQGSTIQALFPKSSAPSSASATGSAPAASQTTASGASNAKNSAKPNATAVPATAAPAISIPRLDKVLDYLSLQRAPEMFISPTNFANEMLWIYYAFYAPFFPTEDNAESSELQTDSASEAIPLWRNNSSKFNVSADHLIALVSIVLKVEKLLKPYTDGTKTLPIFVLLETVLSIADVAGDRVAENVRSFASRLVKSMLKEKLLNTRPFAASFFTSPEADHDISTGLSVLKSSELDKRISESNAAPFWSLLASCDFLTPEQNSVTQVPAQWFLTEISDCWFKVDGESKQKLLHYLEVSLEHKPANWKSSDLLVAETLLFLFRISIDKEKLTESSTKFLLDSIKSSYSCFLAYSIWLSQFSHAFNEQKATIANLKDVETLIELSLDCNSLSHKLNAVNTLRKFQVKCKLTSVPKTTGEFPAESFYKDDEYLALWICHFDFFASADWRNLLPTHVFSDVLSIVETVCQSLLKTTQNYLMKQQLLIAALKVLRNFKNDSGKSEQVARFEVSGGGSTFEPVYCVHNYNVIQIVAAKLLLLVCSCREPKIVTNDLNYQIAKHLSLDPGLKDTLKMFEKLQLFGLDFVIPILNYQSLFYFNPVCGHSIDFALAQCFVVNPTVQRLSDETITEFESFVEVAAFGLSFDQSSCKVKIEKRTKPLINMMSKALNVFLVDGKVLFGANGSEKPLYELGNSNSADPAIEGIDSGSTQQVNTDVASPAVTTVNGASAPGSSRSTSPSNASSLGTARKPGSRAGALPTGAKKSSSANKGEDVATGHSGKKNIPSAAATKPGASVSKNKQPVTNLTSRASGNTTDSSSVEIAALSQTIGASSSANLLSDGKVPVSISLSAAGTGTQPTRTAPENAVDDYDAIDNSFYNHVLTKIMLDPSFSTASSLSFVIGVVEKLEAQLLEAGNMDWDTIELLYEVLFVALVKSSAEPCESFSALACLQHAHVCNKYSKSAKNPVSENLNAQRWCATTTLANSKVLFGDRYALPQGGYKALSLKLSSLSLPISSNLFIIQNSVRGNGKMYYGFASQVALVSKSGSDESNSILKEVWRFGCGTADIEAHSLDKSIQIVVGKLMNEFQTIPDISTFLHERPASSAAAAGANIGNALEGSSAASQKVPKKKSTALDKQDTGTATGVEPVDLAYDNINEVQIPQFHVFFIDSKVWSVVDSFENHVQSCLTNLKLPLNKDLSVVLFLCRLASVGSFRSSGETAADFSSIGVSNTAANKKKGAASVVAPPSNHLANPPTVDVVSFKHIPCSMEQTIRIHIFASPQLRQRLASNFNQLNLYSSKLVVTGGGNVNSRAWLFVSSKAYDETTQDENWFKPTSFLIACDSTAVRAIRSSPSNTNGDETFNIQFYQRFLHLSMEGVDSFLLFSDFEIENLMASFESISSQTQTLTQFLQGKVKELTNCQRVISAGYPYLTFLEV